MRKESKKPVIYVFFGLIASGKSTLAQAWAKRLDINFYNSDILRKQLAGLAPDSGSKDSFDRGIYTASHTQRTYEALIDSAAGELSRGCSVVLDASYGAAVNRQNVCLLAKKYGAGVCFILCSCSETELKSRMKKRALDPGAISDGRWEIYQKQKIFFEEPVELAPETLITLRTLAPVNELVETLVRELELTSEPGSV